MNVWSLLVRCTTSVLNETQPRLLEKLEHISDIDKGYVSFGTRKYSLISIAWIWLFEQLKT